MGTQPPIFISHSSAADADQEALITAIKTNLGADFEILLDQDLLRVGDVWRNELHTWMAMCAGAVVILSRGVLERQDWVLKELTILTWRRSLDPDFVLLPVLLPSVQRSNFDKALFGPLLIGELQMASGDPAAVVAELKQRLEPLLGNGPTHIADRIYEIAAKLSRLTPQECKNVAAKLDAYPLRWSPPLTPHEALARRMIHADFTKLCKVLIETRNRIGPDEASKILDRLFTYWINPEAVVPIPEVVGSTYRAVALNCTRSYTGQLYVRRALCSYTGGWIEVPINNNAGERFVEDVEQQLRDFFRQKNPASWRNLTKEKMQAELRDMGGEIGGIPVFVILDGAVLPADLVELQTRYPRFTFVLGTGETLPKEGYYQRERVRLLLPELDPTFEAGQHRRFTETLAAIGTNS